MFTGIIEGMGEVVHLDHDDQNLNITISSAVSHALKPDQSLSHDGICLTIVDVVGDTHIVTAISETIKRTNLSELKVGGAINLERAMPANGRFDGHIVQGHVDSTAICQGIEEAGGSWYFSFSFSHQPAFPLVDKGSICVNGVSLTVVDPVNDSFKVAIIPYTMEHTNFGQMKTGDLVNIEFDVLGKYIARMMDPYLEKYRPEAS